jgi:hypothetical protein
MKQLLLFLFSLSALYANPAQVIIIRHAEKPPAGTSLTLKGRERAAALVPFFLGAPPVLQFGPPTAIYAARPTAQHPSLRSEQTVQSLADEMKLPLLTQYNPLQVEQLAEEILTHPDYEDKMVLICWSHTEIPRLAAHLGAKKSPKRWPDDSYDRLWILNFDPEGSVSFENLPQKLLFGDASK